MFLIDTVTLSELRKRERDQTVVKWFQRQRTTDLFLSVISIGEIERGIARQTRILRARLRPGWIGYTASSRAIRPANSAALGRVERRARQ